MPTVQMIDTILSKVIIPIGFILTAAYPLILAFLAIDSVARVGAWWLGAMPITLDFSRTGSPMNGLLGILELGLVTLFLRKAWSMSEEVVGDASKKASSVDR